MKHTILFTILFLASSMLLSASRPDPPSELMEKKSQHAQNILKYLAMADLPTVAREAEQMKKITEEAGFSDKSEKYEEYGREFLKSVSELKRSAESGNLAGSYYQFSRMTSICFSCHEHIRNK